MPPSSDTRRIRTWIWLVVAVMAVASLRVALGQFAAQGLLFIGIAAVAAWWVEPRLGVVAAVLGFVAAHILRFVYEPESLFRPTFLLTRTYWVGISTYVVLCAVVIAIGKSRQVTLRRLRAEKEASDAAEVAHSRRLQEALDREMAARHSAEAATARIEALQRRLVGLAAASKTLLRTPEVREVLPAMLQVAANVVPADAHAVWRVTNLGEWRIVAHSGLGDEFVAAAVWTAPVRSFEIPIAIEDIASRPLPDALHAAYSQERIRSMLIAPLLIEGAPTGFVAFYYRETRRFDDADLQAAHSFGNLASAVLNAAQLYDTQQQTRAESEFLADAGVLLSSSLDYALTLRQVAKLAVPRFADFCAVDLLVPSGIIERLAVEHVDPSQVAFAEEFHRKYPEDPQSPYSVAHAIQTAQPSILEWLDDELLDASLNDEQRADVRRLAIRSFMVIPMVARDRGFGAITFASQSRRYTQDDLRFAMMLVSRAALAVDNAHAYNEARRADRLKDEFLATLSHELRTPLNAVLGYSRMLNQGVISGEGTTRALATLERNALLLARIVDDVLEVSRFMAGKVELRKAPIHLADVVLQAVASVKPAAEAKQIDVCVADAEGVPTIEGDAARLQQVAFNLLSNAVKFTAPGGQVRIRTEVTGSNVALVVSDSGIGIAPEFLPFVFDRFRQEEAGLSREHGGLGLGLSIARDIVHLHKGRISVMSEGRGKGTEFRVELPLHRSSPDAPPALVATQS